LSTTTFEYFCDKSIETGYDKRAVVATVIGRFNSQPVITARLVMFSGVCRRLSSSVTLHMQRNLPGEARDGGPVVSRPVKTTLCCTLKDAARCYEFQFNYRKIFRNIYNVYKMVDRN